MLKISNILFPQTYPQTLTLWLVVTDDANVQKTLETVTFSEFQPAQRFELLKLRSISSSLRLWGEGLAAKIQLVPMSGMEIDKPILMTPRHGRRGAR